MACSMSNTSYGKALDVARFNWLLDVVGPAMGPEGIWSPVSSFCLFVREKRGFWEKGGLTRQGPGQLGQTAFAFFSEIPMLTSYNIEVSIVSWDGKWVRLFFPLM